ncbi:Phosphatidylinositol transfer protein beta isoform [Ophiophagus hannah]|uniref:Phosphatidylinositol transfer protein beta isoform n=1 Tax=Ophiophagus hannah TaxID=8665 RepID=V8PFC7_OPHHA|nr:Phosphatidylinositol transfer protein beta isoform [Ophiophagus hannah]
MNPTNMRENRGSTPIRSTTFRAKFQDSSRCLPQRGPLLSTKEPGMPILTVGRNEYMKDDFFVKIETWHKPDLGEEENVHGLDADTWKDVEIFHIDIGDRTQVSNEDYKPDEDPALFKSLKTSRGPLGPDWKRELANNEDCPHMCAYKLVTVKFRWWGLQGRVEKFIQKQERRLFTNFHRQLFCWLDKWVDLSMADIRRMEDETQKELDEVLRMVTSLGVEYVLDKIRQKGTVRGMTVGDE